MKIGKFKGSVMLREHNFLHKATNELVKLMSALWVSREHTSRERHPLFKSKMGTGQSHRSWERLLRRGEQDATGFAAGLHGMGASKC